MTRFHLLSVALIALTATSACSHGNYNAGAALGGASSTGPQSGSGDNGGGAASSSGGVNLSDRLAGTLASAGNLVDTSGVSGPSNALAPAASATLNGTTIVGGAGPSALAANIGAGTQSSGQMITVGVLSNGQVSAPSTQDGSGAAAPGANLIGANANDQQVLAGGPNQIIGASVGSHNPQQGSAASANVLSNGQLANTSVTVPNAPAGVIPPGR
jgi:hypothetical protein